MLWDMGVKQLLYVVFLSTQYSTKAAAVFPPSQERKGGWWEGETHNFSMTAK